VKALVAHSLSSPIASPIRALAVAATEYGRLAPRWAGWRASGREAPSERAAGIRLQESARLWALRLPVLG